MAQARLMIIAKDQNGKYWLYGEVNGMDLSEGTIASGLNFGDRNGYDLTFMGREPQPAREVLASAFTAV